MQLYEGFVQTTIRSGTHDDVWHKASAHQAIPILFRAVRRKGGEGQGGNVDHKFHNTDVSYTVFLERFENGARAKTFLDTSVVLQSSI